jgi:hypothetical protein
MPDADDFRRLAQYARRMAKSATAEEDKALWLGLAEDWMHLARNSEGTDRCH